MPATGQDITHYAGDSATIVIGPVKDETGAAVDLNGASARWWMGKNAAATGADVYLKKSSAETQVNENGDTVDQIDFARDVDNWTLTIRLLASDTETTETGIKPGTYYHEAEVVDADGRVSTVTLGKYTLKPTIVRNA